MEDLNFGDAASDPLAELPPELRERAGRLPEGKEYTVLTLPEPGDGHNAGLLTVAATCHRMGVSYDDTLEHLSACYSRDRIDYDHAPERAVKRVWAADGDLGKLTSGDTDDLPSGKDELLLRFRRTPHTALVEASPGNLNATPLEVVQTLFAGGDTVNIQHGALEHGTLVKCGELPLFLEEKNADLADYKFLNPATFKKVEGVPNPTPKNPNKVSTRCNDNVKTRRYMVLEFDAKPDDPDGEIKAERFNTFCLTLAQFAPLRMAVDTGGKSIHYWFDADGCPAPVRKMFFIQACLHGADKRMGVKSQIARMPNTPSAEKGRGPQRLIYWDPDRENCPAAWDLSGFEKHLNTAKQLDFYYLPGSFPYWTRDAGNRWVQLSEGRLKVHLATMGFRRTLLEGEEVSPADEIIKTVELEKNLEAALIGASGRQAGYYEEHGARFLVLKSPHFVKPRRDKWPTIDKLLRGLFEHDELQLPALYGWLSSGVRDLRNGGKRQAVYSHAQMVFIIGPANAGKSLLLNEVFRPCFGGRMADAEPMFQKSKSDFNADTFQSELLYLDDPDFLEPDYKSRSTFGARIKNFTVGAGGDYHAKFGNRLTVKPWHRFACFMNDEPAQLATLPPLEPGVEDKMIFLRAKSLADSEIDNTTPGWFNKVSSDIAKEIPAFLHFLLHEWQTPDYMLDPAQRYPVQSYKCSFLVSEFEEGSAEQYLEYRIENDCYEALFVPGGADFGEDESEDGFQPVPWQGSLDNLYDILCAGGTLNSQKRFLKTCPSPRVLIAQMRYLEAKGKARYSKRCDTIPTKVNNKYYWIVDPPRGAVDLGGPDVEDLEIEKML